jgi:hypothetical protein
MLGRTMAYALAAAVLLAAVMTFGDLLWAVMHIRHTVTAGLLHGAAMCLFLGAVIGFRAGRLAVGTIGGPVIGVLAAGLFYLLAPSLRMMAMFPAWMFFWICFAIMQSWLQKDRGVVAGLIGGIAAAVLSGLAFYAISGIWTRHDPGGPSYAWNLAAWTFAFFPGFAALFWRPAPARPA